MGFRQRHPYLFWQLIGWGILLADFGFLVISALCEFGEWCYPIIVFTFIIGLFFVTVSPVIVRLTRRRLIPQNNDAYTERLFVGKISALLEVRRGVGISVSTAVLAISSIIVFIFAAYILGDRVHLALGFACIVLAVVSPFLILGIYSKSITRSFFTVKNGEKRVEFTIPADLKELLNTNPRTLVITGEPNAVLLNFFYNWLKYYLKTEQLTLYRIHAPDLCHDFQPISQLRYQNVLLCIPTEQLDLTNEKETLFNNECAIMGALPFSNFVDFNEENEESDY
ncbi:MAG: hypothetical protein HDT42_11825 [Ruminococcaceae bacterium]|nr:hypothetical protein [Oscillospiraceae bacterium]